MDADHDGDLDLLVATIGDSSITCFLNSDGTGKFGQTLSLSGWFEYVINADVDGNDDLDIIAGHLYDMVLYKNVDNKGTFSRPADMMDNGTSVQAFAVLDSEITPRIALIYAPADTKELILIAPEKP